MTEYQQRINDLLECCQNEWVNLETLTKENNATSSIIRASKDLHEGIKKLVQLQDNLDEIGNIVENNSEWNRKADILMDDVKKRLEFASALTSQVKPMVSQSSPIGFSTTAAKYNTTTTTNTNTNTTTNLIKEEEEEEEEEFLDAINNNIILEDNDNEDIRPTFGRKSILLENQTEKKKILQFPLFKGLRTSQSTPVNSQQPAQINFYKNDSKNFLFATDAIVDHPLRIGIGYGSYICYSCTILSDKGAPITVRKRYSDFVELRDELLKTYPTLKKSIPKLPPKKVVGKFTPTFVEQRRKELEYFFKFVVLHPTLGASPIVKHWIAP